MKLPRHYRLIDGDSKIGVIIRRERVFDPEIPSWIGQAPGQGAPYVALVNTYTGDALLEIRNPDVTVTVTSGRITLDVGHDRHLLPDSMETGPAEEPAFMFGRTRWVEHRIPSATRGGTPA